MATEIINGLPHYNLVSTYTLPDDIFSLNSIQGKAQVVKPNIASVRVRDRGVKPGTEEVEIKTLAYDADSLQDMNRDRDIAPSEFDTLLADLQTKYLFPFQSMTDSELMKQVYALWNIDTLKGSEITMKDIQMGYESNLCQILSNYMMFVRHNMVGPESPESLYNMQVFNKMLKTIYIMNNLLKSKYSLRKSTDETLIDEDEDVNLFRFTPQDFSKNTSFQNLLIYLLNKAYQKGYRLYRESCYEQIYYKGNPTHAWKFVCSVVAFVYKSIDKEVNFEMWQNLTRSTNNAKQAADYLISANDKEFPLLEPDRHLFSFTDGVYDAKTMTFYSYDTAPLPSNRVAIRFFQQKFNPRRLLSKYKSWWKIPTPNLQGILDTQKLPKDACKILYMMMGRCIYDVGEMDTWEVVLFIKGIAGSGKSTLGKILKNLYPTTDIAILSSNIEKKFGLQSIYDKLLYLCFEVKKNWGLDQGDFQCMISGEEVSVAQKHKVAISVLWKTPGMLMGNETAKMWMDAAGSMTRRVCTLAFDHKVKAQDTTLGDRLRANMPAIIHKINAAYHAAVQDIGTASIWNHLPDYFQKTSKDLAQSINPLVDFLENCDLVEVNSKGNAGDDDCYMPLDVFKDIYMAFCRRNNYDRFRFNADHYRTVFQQYGLSTQRADKIYDNVLKKNIQWIIGVKLKEDDEAVDATV